MGKAPNEDPQCCKDKNINPCNLPSVKWLIGYFEER